MSDSQLASDGSPSHRRRYRIAVVVETSKSYGRGIIRGIGRYVQHNGQWNQHSLFVEERGLEDSLPSWINPSQCDGIIIRSKTSAFLEDVIKLGIPTVCLGEENPVGAYQINTDETQAAIQAADHLLNCRFKRFAYIGIEDYVWSQKRERAFITHIQQAGYACETFKPVEREYWTRHWELLHDELTDWLTHLETPIGIFCCYDIAARNLLNVLRLNEIAVPEQVAVVGVDNDEVLCEIANPTLTSVDLNSMQVGYEAARLLDELLNRKAASKNVIVSPHGVVKRQSTDIVAVEDPDVALALGYIRKNACIGISVYEVLKKIPLSRRSLERKFKHYLGCSPLEEIRRVRIEHVCRLLQDTDMKIDAIARQCGYSSTSYMAKELMRIHDQNPSEYRENYTRSLQHLNVNGSGL